MRPIVPILAAAAIVGLAPLLAYGDESSERTPDAATASGNPEDARSSDVKDGKAREAKAFKAPPGYKPKRRGKHVVYCKKSTEKGTRIAAERCYDETQLRELQAQMEQDKVNFDQSRSVCSNLSACGGG